MRSESHLLGGESLVQVFNGGHERFRHLDLSGAHTIFAYTTTTQRVTYTPHGDVGDILDFLLLVAAGLGDLWEGILVPSVRGVEEGSEEPCLLGRMRPLLEYSVAEKE